MKNLVLVPCLESWDRNGQIFFHLTTKDYNWEVISGPRSRTSWSLRLTTFRILLKAKTSSLTNFLRWKSDALILCSKHPECPPCLAASEPAHCGGGPIGGEGAHHVFYVLCATHHLLVNYLSLAICSTFIQCTNFGFIAYLYCTIPVMSFTGRFAHL